MRRKTVVASFIFQALLICVSAALIESRFVPGNAGDLLPDDFIVLLPLALLAMQSAGQIVMSRILGFGEVTTVVLTSAYCDLAFDPEITAPLKENSKRNRRIGSIVMLFLGAVAGGFLTANNDLSLALWVAAAIKVAIGITWMFWKGNGSVRLE